MAKKKVSKTSAKKTPRKPATTSRKSAEPAKSPKPKAARKKTPAAIQKELQRVDKDIVKLINKRAQLTIDELHLHENPTAAAFDPAADEELWLRLQADSTAGPLPWHAVRGVYRSILSAARQTIKSQRVAYLGPAYSFTHIAAMERFGESADLVPVNTIASVFEEVNRGHTQYGVVPIENSTDGRVVDTLDMFTRLPLRICGEVQIAIHHNLLSRCPRSEITEIYSKPQALSQCRDWLSRNMPSARLIEVTSTSTAAQLARDKHGAAAVASQQAATQYDLQIICASIQDNRDNVTRFAIIGEDVGKSTGKDRTAILLQIKHKPGSLSDSLTAFKNHKVNLTWIESFPLRGPESGYLFFLDFEGHMTDAKVRKTLDGLAKHAVRIEVLGSYPRSEPI